MFDKLFEAFHKKQKKLYYVGGSVRDMILGKLPNDYDFTTDALPQDIQHILDNAGFKHWPLGEKFGTIAATVNGTDIEITTHRKDMTTGRHPDVVFATNLETDLERRDFTINSIAMDYEGNLIDPFNGVKDINDKLIRTTLSPADRFGEDPLRMLRAIRFVSQLGFNIHTHTETILNSFAHTIMSVSKERLLEEMNKLLMGNNTKDALEYFYKSRLLGYIIPELFPITIRYSYILPSKDLWYHTKYVVSNSVPKLDVRWAALLHDIAKPQTRFENKKEVHFFNHEYLGAEMASCITKRLKMSNKQSNAIVGLIALHQRICDIVGKDKLIVSKNSLRRLVRDCEKRGCSIDSLIDLFTADCSSGRKDIQEQHHTYVLSLEKALNNMKEEDLRPKLPKGIGESIMKRFNLSPGPRVGMLKNKLDQLLLDGIINNKMTIDEMLNCLG